MAGTTSAELLGAATEGAPQKRAASKGPDEDAGSSKAARIAPIPQPAAPQAGQAALQQPAPAAEPAVAKPTAPSGDLLGVRIVATSPRAPPRQSAPAAAAASGAPIAARPGVPAAASEREVPRARTKASVQAAQRLAQVAVPSAAATAALAVADVASARSSEERAHLSSVQKQRGAEAASGAPGAVGAACALQDGRASQQAGPDAAQGTETAAEAETAPRASGARGGVPEDAAMDAAPSSADAATTAHPGDTPDTHSATAHSAQAAAAVANATAETAPESKPGPSAAVEPRRSPPARADAGEAVAPSDPPRQAASGTAAAPAAPADASVPMPPKPQRTAVGRYDLRYEVAAGPEDLAFRDATIALYRQHYQAAKRDGVRSLCPFLSRRARAAAGLSA